MKKFISTKMKIFITFLIVLSVGCYIAAGVTLYNSNYKLSDYVNNWDFHDWRIGWNFDWNEYNSSGIIEKDLAPTVENINLKSTSSDLSFQFYNESKLKVEVSGHFDRNYDFNEGIHNFSLTDKDILIEANESHRSSSLNIKVFIPSSYKGNISITSTSGEIKCTGGDINQLTINSLSGDIETYNVITKSSTLSSTSGKIYSSNLNSLNTQVKTTSGDIDIIGNIGDASINTSSGEISLNLSSLNKNLDISTSSGEVELDIPSNENYKLNFTTSSGDLGGSFGNVNIESGRTYSVTNGDGSNSINVKTTSGDLDIN